MPRKRPEVLTPQMREAISRSGYLLEQRLVPYVERRGYKATPNHRFTDPVSGAGAELDIHAISAVSFSSRRDFFFPILLVECKNLRCPLVFFTQREFRLRYFLGQPHISGLPCKIQRRGRPIDLVEYLQFEDFHHYYTRARIASQFCAVFLKKEALKRTPRGTFSAEDYVAGHKVDEIDLFSDGILKLIRALGAERRVHAETFRGERRTRGVHLQFYYPILVTAGSLYECFIRGSRPAYKRVHRIGFVHRRVDESSWVDDRLDVTDVVGFRRLLGVIKREMERTREILKKRRRLLEEATAQNSSRLVRFPMGKRLAIIAGDVELQ